MGEEWTLQQVRSCNADGYLVRNYDHLKFFANERRIGAFSLNIANRLAADYFKNRFGLERITASYDLNFQQLEALLHAAPPERFEITIHQHIPMFHMEHCVFCAFLTTGRDYRDCGRPCDVHELTLRDRVGAEHPVKADVGCRNTVFNALAQTGAEYVSRMIELGVRHFRVEFLSAVLGVATWLWVRDRPEDRGYRAVNPAAGSGGARVDWKKALRAVLANPATWPGFFVNMGIGGSYLAFAGLWAVGWLEHTYAMSKVAAAQHASALLLGIAFGSVAIGVISDRLGNRRAVMRVYTFLYALSWIPLLLRVSWPVPASLAWFLLMGLLIPGFTLSWTIAKEANPVEFAGRSCGPRS